MFKKDVQDYEFLPMHVEFFIIGGGLTGSSIAYWIKQYCRDENITVTVLENPENVGYFLNKFLKNFKMIFFISRQQKFQFWSSF